ncbi:hypothetical protein BC834DRAFT_896182 [Gloeopeniophorella convolvens]|nr:hypothetical protein BC834DRAFT_896182 [Gloeopeniophorella convolvens]
MSSICIWMVTSVRLVYARACLGEMARGLICVSTTPQPDPPVRHRQRQVQRRDDCTGSFSPIRCLDKSRSQG